MSGYEKLAWEWQNRSNLEAALSRRAATMFPYRKRRFGKYQPKEVSIRLPWGGELKGRETTREVAARVDPSDALPEGDIPDRWLTVEELADEFDLSVNTMKRHASKVGDADKRMTVTGADRQYTWRWDRDGKFDPKLYDPPGWRAYNKFRQAANRDSDRRLPEAFRGHGQRLEGRRDVSRIGPSDRRSTSHGGYVGEQAEMLEHAESLYSVDPGMAPRQDKGQRVKEYRLSAVRAVIEARKPTSGRFTKGAGHAE